MTHSLSENISLAKDEVPNEVPRDVLVSVIITAFQHVDYIAQAVESVLSQKTTFAYEICLGEDDSTDGTREICQKYAAQYPDRIRLFLRSDADKTWAEGRKTGKHNIIQTFRAARGKYLALLDGDDFWIHPNKLQMQVDYLERTPGCEMCATRALKWGYSAKSDTESGVRSGNVSPATSLSHIGLADVLAGGTLVNTCTMMFLRAAAPELPVWADQLIQGDWVLMVSILQNGSTCAVLPAVTAIYRVHAGGAFQSKRVHEDWYLNLREKHLRAYLEVAPSRWSVDVMREICDVDLRRFWHLRSFQRFKKWMNHPPAVVVWTLFRAIKLVGTRRFNRFLLSYFCKQSPELIEGFSNDLLNPRLGSVSSLKR